MFVEYSAAEDLRFEPYFEFTEEEVRDLCEKHFARRPNARADYEGLAYWYDGYLAEDGSHRFNPRSVALALAGDSLRS